MSAPRNRLALSVALAVTAAYALGAAATTPFTTAADVVTAIPIAALAAGAAVRWPWRPVPGGDVTAVGTESPGSLESSASLRRHPYAAWAALVAAVVVWELVEYLAPGSRGAHPTLSSMADAVDRHFGLKAAVFFGWVWLCVLVVREGSGPSR